MLALLSALPVFAVLMFLRWRLCRGTIKHGLGGRYFFNCLFFMLFYAACVLGLADPAHGTRRVPERRTGADIALALDISRSMDVADAVDDSGETVSRLTAAREGLESIVESLAAGSRYSVTAGKGTAVTALPLSSDTEAVFSLLESLTPEALSSRSTNLEALVEKAAASLGSGADGRKKFLVLATDGDALYGDLDKALKKAAAGGVSVVILGAGSAAGGLVPGSEFHSSCQEGALKSATSGAGGFYGALGEGGAREAAGWIAAHGGEAGGGSSEGDSTGWTYRTERASLREPLLVLALLFFAGMILVRRTRR
jgi:hypothetical protein